MHIKSDLFILWIAFFLFTGCHSESFKKTKSGLKYKIIRDVAGHNPENGEIMYFNMDYFDEKDSLLFTYRSKNIPVTMQYIDTVWEQNGQIYKGLEMLGVGDSGVFKVNCRDLYEKSFRVAVPSGMDPDSEITFYVGVEKISTREEFRLWQAEQYLKQQNKKEKIQEEQLNEDLAIIDYYMEEMGIIPLELESGIRYIINDKGVGDPPEKGDKVTIHFSGKLLDGTEFDNTFDKKEPFEFVIGFGNVIKGLDEGISLMPEGARYTFYIPSTLAFGAQRSGPIIRPNSILVYEVELLNIERK
jgi:FKBP-type peptidyl-prolyl cis-trans isomerase